MANVDPITLEIVRARLDGIVREMEVAVFRTGYSTIVRESRDFSCGLLDRDGRVVGNASHPTHMGGYPACIEGLMRFFGFDDLREGDAFLANHPYHSGVPHANDMVVMVPIFARGEVVAFAVSLGHTPDIGGVAAGSRNATARDLFGEGLQLAPLRFMRDGKMLQDTANVVRANSRVPDMMIGDLEAKVGVCFAIGTARLKDVMDTFGVDSVLQAFADIGDSSEGVIRDHIAGWLDGVHEAEAWVDDPTSPDSPIRLHVAAIKEGDRLVMDFTGTGNQAAAPINVRPPFLRGLVYRAIVAMTDPSLPLNHGITRAVECRFRDGTIINPEFPGPVGFYSKTLSIADSVVMSAMAKAAGRPTVAYGSTQSSIVLGQAGSRGRPYVQYELMYAGSRAWDGGDGYTGTGHGMGGGKFTSVEIIESEFDVEMTQFQVMPDSGGDGKYRGGPGYVRDYRMLAPGRLSGGAAKREAQGMDGGGDGRNAYVVVFPDTDKEQVYPGICSNIGLETGESFRIETGGGGAVLPARDRAPQQVIDDIADGYITPAKARDIYGLTDAQIEASSA
jgi:N-methylhydantoinase B